ncbi:MAG: pilus assembly protein N-terminal domain-containing protein, partial [Selenomonadaceae bacterium]|nr:pilus assembly protein N-terminal domain-containing protein [Selenomonadaceae bacterium]
MNSWGIRAGLLAGALVCATPVAMAATTLSLGMNEYFHFTAHGVVSRVAVGNPEVADVKLLSDDTEFLIVGKKPGTTTLLVWYTNGLL